MKSVIIAFCLVASWNLVVCDEDLEICGNDDYELSSVFDCIRLHTSPTFQEQLSEFGRHLQCDSDVCLVRRWCKKGNFRTQAFRHFTYDHFMELYDAAEQCQAPSPPSQPSHVQGSIWKAFVKWIRFMIISRR